MQPLKHQDSSPTGDRLSAVRTLDRKQEIFGADYHHYELTQVSADELAEFEAWCGVSLPATYRDHLLTFGHGAGPYYGLWSPAAIRKELESLHECLEPENLPPPRISDPFPLTLADAQNCRNRSIAGESEPWITAAWPLAGCLPICSQGCEYYSVLQVTGDAPGSVWDISESGVWIPGHRPTGLIGSRRPRPPLPELEPTPTFEAWYQSWIDQIIADFSP
ncbi:SMI1/KNR4 family protein [Prosthecobacter sp.]|uniref:SMI1/KNR4 family protein n=1 Tax=Prosthecobacter sp. TaxID=1965333 RepID=UPI003782E650